jgi:hypothetical protein
MRPLIHPVLFGADIADAAKDITCPYVGTLRVHLSTENKSGHDHPEPNSAEQDDFSGRLLCKRPICVAGYRARMVSLNLRKCTIAQLSNVHIIETIIHSWLNRRKPITQVSTKAWYAALERAGIADFRWHDLRHSWASWHVQNGTPLFALQELGGWESPRWYGATRTCRRNTLPRTRIGWSS